MRRILYYSLLCFLWVSVNSCKDDEASQPPPPTISVDKTSGLLSADEFTFTVEQVGAGSISLIPYGTDNPSFGGVLIPSSAFTNGVAKVKFTYGHVGTFAAVASSTNHSGDGASVKTSYSSPVTVTIESDKAELSDFSFDGSTDTDVDDEVDPIAVTITIPWSKHNDITKLKLRYTNSAESKVTVGGTAQSSDGTENNFTSPVTYTVTSQNGDVSQDYKVTVIQTPAETNTNIKSLAATIANKGKLGASLKSATGRTLPSYVDNTNNVIVIYDTLNVVPNVYDSLSLDIALDGKFSNLKFHEANWGKHKLNDRYKGKDTVDLKAGAPLQLEVTAEDSTRKVYDVYTAEAPKLHAETTNLTPNRSGDSNEAFAVGLDAISGTDTENVDFAFTFTDPANGSVVAVDVVEDGGAPQPATDVLGTWVLNGVNAKKAITVKATVHPTTGGLPDFIVSYSVSITIK